MLSVSSNPKYVLFNLIGEVNIAPKINYFKLLASLIVFLAHTHINKTGQLKVNIDTLLKPGLLYYIMQNFSFNSGIILSLQLTVLSIACLLPFSKIIRHLKHFSNMPMTTIFYALSGVLAGQIYAHTTQINSNQGLFSVCSLVTALSTMVTSA